MPDRLDLAGVFALQERVYFAQGSREIVRLATGPG